MTKAPQRTFLFLLAAPCLISCGASLAIAQQAPTIRLPRPSQKASVMQTLGDADITITYSRPGVRGRRIWGDATQAEAASVKGEATLDNQNTRPNDAPIVPWGHVWRAGANEATTFGVTRDVLLNGQKLAAGNYSLHTIPKKDEWTIVFNAVDNQWGSFAYDPAKDALRIRAKPLWAQDSQEWLTYSFDAVTDYSAEVNIRWETVRVPFTVALLVARKPPQRTSQKSTVMQTIGVTDVILTYSGQEPGENEASQFVVTDDVLINGQKLPAGTYRLHTIPGKDEWIIAFNGVSQQARYDEEKDLLRVSAKPQEMLEKEKGLRYFIPFITANSATLVLRWERLAVPFTVEIPNVEATWRTKVDAAMAANPTDASIPLAVARFYTGDDKWDEALKWADMSIKIKETFQNLSFKANVLYAAGRKTEAFTVADQALARGKADNIDTRYFEKRLADMRTGILARQESTTAKANAPTAQPTTTPAVQPTTITPVQSITITPATQPTAMTPAIAPVTPLVTGRYYALLIGNDHYRYVPGLKMAAADARAVAALLQTNYGFSTKVLLDATRQDIISSINNYRRTLDSDDSLLVYYAGHGYYDRDVDRAYWLPIDASADDNSNWISADDITGNIRGVVAKHVLIVSDSCYSGTISRELVLNVGEPSARSRFLQRMMAGKSRTLMSSGGNEPVSDGGGSGHSVFARAFLTGLEESDKIAFTASDLFHDFIQERVAGGARQTPEYSPLRNSGHESGDFVFVRK